MMVFETGKTYCGYRYLGRNTRVGAMFTRNDRQYLRTVYHALIDQRDTEYIILRSTDEYKVVITASDSDHRIKITRVGVECHIHL